MNDSTSNPTNPQITPEISARFWSKVQKTDGCWLWMARWTRHGYGRFWFLRKSVSAHRVAWELEFGAVPSGLLVLHKCDNPPCCNPQHLFIGSDSDNNRDMVTKGRDRHPYGESHGCVKLNEEIVMSIRQDSRSLRVLAAIYGVDFTTIADIKRHRTWKHII